MDAAATEATRPLRSLLFVPADSPRKLEKGLRSGADALILDLEDSVALSAKEAARRGAADLLAAQQHDTGGPALIVRVNALDSGLVEADLDAVIALKPYAVMLPKATGGADVQHLSVKIAVREAEAGVTEGAVRILPIVTETGAAMFGLSSYRGASRRLLALTWGAEDLMAAIGAQTNRLPDGDHTPPFALARNLTLFAAASADVPALDTIFAQFRDTALFARECAAARRDGFVGKMAIHPDQIAPIHDAFTPDEQEVTQARRIVEAFAAQPDAGVLSIDGAMIDRPHLRKAQRILAAARL